MNTSPHSSQESLSFSPWSRPFDPGSILLIRFHALGDVAVTLPSSKGLRDRYPGARIDFLTLPSAAGFLRSLALFDHVFEFPLRKNRAASFAAALRWGLHFRRQNYDVILDLQRNRLTRVIRRMASPEAWSEFDRFSPRSASDRVNGSFERGGLDRIVPSCEVSTNEREQEEALHLLHQEGYQGGKKLVVLNPAGLWETRNWPLENYVSLAEWWLNREPVQFVIMGTERVLAAASFIRSRLGVSLIDLVGKTRLETAFSILQHASAVITEDSGLMHMAWCAGVPVVALFGSSNHIWSSPPGPLTRVLHSGDLPCGACMDPHCAYGDVHCLTRYTPEQVGRMAIELTALVGDPHP